jgi:murein DD-endopeptidase MepM/ murein hydrolase activator NlpD
LSFLILCGAGFTTGFGVGAWSVGLGSDGAHEQPTVFDQEAPRASPMVLPAAAASKLEPLVATPPARLAELTPEAMPESTSRAVTERVADIEVRRGDTLLGILTGAGINATEAHEAVSRLRTVANLRSLRAGQRLGLETTAGAEGGQRLARLVWPMDAAREIHLVRAADGRFATEDVERPLTSELFRAHGAIAGSLYQSARRAGLPAQSLAEMIALLSWDLDLQRDIHAGDRFETVLERRRDGEGEVVAYGDLVYVGLTTRERTIAAYRFTGPDGKIGFFDRDGRALRKWLLRTPVDGARLSSEFGPRRHPVLGYTRMHKGIDFAAPPGTPILAAGDGVVAFAGRNRGYGNYVKLRHDGAYDTAYAHLSRFAKGLKRGHRVSQGQVIGYVGSTGLSTGPHLHYEVLHQGEQVDPQRLKAAYAEQLRGEALKRFLAHRGNVDRLRDGEPSQERLVAQRNG